MVIPLGIFPEDMVSLRHRSMHRRLSKYYSDQKNIGDNLDVQQDIYIQMMNYYIAIKMMYFQSIINNMEKLSQYDVYYVLQVLYEVCHNIFA